VRDHSGEWSAGELWDKAIFRSAGVDLWAPKTSAGPNDPPTRSVADSRWRTLLNAKRCLSCLCPVFGLCPRSAVEGEVRLDQHDCFYTTNVLDGTDGRPVLVSWVRHWTKGRGWNGCLAAPRRVHAEGNGIRQEVLPGWLEALAEGEART